MKEVVAFILFTVVMVVVFTHFYNNLIPQHEYPEIFKFLKNI